MTFHILGMSSSQLTNSYFSEGLEPPTKFKSGLKLVRMGEAISRGQQNESHGNLLDPNVV